MALLLLVSIATFAPTLDNGFILDDDYMLAHNASIRDLHNLASFFTSTPPESINRGYYRPVMLAAFAIDYAIFGLRAPGFHFVNILCHAAVACLVLLLLLQLGASAGASTLGALLFALHPMQGEVVYLVTYRANALCAFFMFLALLFYLRRRAGTLSLGSCCVLGLLYFLALGSKEIGVTLPLLLLAADVFLPTGRRVSLAPYAVCCVVLLGYAGIRQLLCEPSSVSYFGNAPGLLVLRAMIVTEAYAVTLLFLPRSLAATYDASYLPWPTSFTDPMLLTAAALLLGLLWLAYRLRHKAPRIAFGIAFYFLALLPTYNILRSPNLFGERFLYVPLFGLCLLLALALDALHRPRLSRLGSAGVIAVICVFAMQNHARAYTWRTEVSYWQSAVGMRPQSLQVHVGLAKALSDRRRCSEALPHYAFALARVAPSGGNARMVYGEAASCLSLTGNQDGALAVVERWLAAQPADTGFAQMRSTLARAVHRAHGGSPP